MFESCPEGNTNFYPPDEGGDIVSFVSLYSCSMLKVTSATWATRFLGIVLEVYFTGRSQSGRSGINPVLRVSSLSTNAGYAGGKNSTRF
jgi:hypothetical protein